MARYIDTDYLDELITQLNNDGRGITRKEYKMIDSILFEFPTANVVDKERYDRLLENATIISEALNKYQNADMVERKKGKWINDRDLYKCSCCNKLWNVWWAGVVPIEQMKKVMPYCPMCGSYNGEAIEDDMRGEEDE